MLELSTPGLLFNGQKVFHLRGGAITTDGATQIYKAIVVYDYPHKVLPQPAKEMLDKLMLACKFAPEETLYLNAGFSGPISLAYLENKYTPQIVLVFGEVSISRNLSKLKKNFPYELNGVKIMNTESLELLMKNDATKKAFWAVLKKTLGI